MGSVVLYILLLLLLLLLLLVGERSFPFNRSINLDGINLLLLAIGELPAPFESIKIGIKPIYFHWRDVTHESMCMQLDSGMGKERIKEEEGKSSS